VIGFIAEKSCNLKDNNAIIQHDETERQEVTTKNIIRNDHENRAIKTRLFETL
jgi:hypothetical protein